MNPNRLTDDAARPFEVHAADGASLAVWVGGDGPPLVMVHGSMADHTSFDSFVEVARDDFTTFAMDRRGCGASSAAAGYSIERDFEDVAAVVDAVAARTLRPVALFGHSHGANCAMGGAAIATNVDRLVLLEPSLTHIFPPGSIDAVEAAAAAGDMEGAIVAVLVAIQGMTSEEVDAVRASPLWPARVAAAPTVAQEFRSVERWVYQPGRFDGITAPTLLLMGSETLPDLAETTRRAAAAIPDAEIRVLEGQGHYAHRTDPATVSAVIRHFLSS